jgi:hypothetical protein
LLGELAEEFGPGEVAPVAFHVDYFDDPWKDPYSDPRHSRRELEYSRIYARERGLQNEGHLYLTPLLMIDGRVPMVGSNADAPERARRAIREALRRRSEVTLDAAPSADGQAVAVEVAARGGGLAGKPVLVELIATEDGLETDVRAGELEGRRYLARHVARGYAVESVRLPRRTGEPARVELKVPGATAGGDSSRRALLVVVQDERTGRVYQARRLEWPSAAGR